MSPCGDVSVIKVMEAAKLSELVRTYVHGLCKKLEIRIIRVNWPLGLNMTPSLLFSPQLVYLHRVMTKMSIFPTTPTVLFLT